MLPILALSTAWCSARHTDGYEMLREMASLGFEYVELSHGIRITLVPGVLKALDEGIVGISSTHNFCPLPTGIAHAAPNLFEPSAPAGGGHEQEHWLRHTRRTIDFAVQVKARAVVMHLGSVRFWWLDPARRLRRFAERHPGADLAADPRYQQLLARASGKLSKRLPIFWDQAQRSVREILPYAGAKGMLLGFENRERFEELPRDVDFPEFLKAIAPPDQAGYWHDAGHAELKERMGVITQQRLLEENAPRLIGFHLHDVDADGNDHQAVGKGRVDFKLLRQFWQPHHVLVLELHRRLSSADVLESKKRIENLL